MSFRLANLVPARAAALLAVCVATSVLAADPPERGSTPSQPGPSRAAAAKEDTGAQRPELKSLEEALSRPLRSLDPRSAWDDALDAQFSPPTPRQTFVPGRRTRELMDRRRNWIFMAPEDVVQGTTAEEIFKLQDYGSDGEEKGPATLIERYYERLKRGAGGRAAGKSDWLGLQQPETGPDSSPFERAPSLSSGKSEAPANIWSFKSFAPEPASTFVDGFGFDTQKAATTEKEREQEQKQWTARKEAFEKIWNFDQPAAPPAPSPGPALSSLNRDASPLTASSTPAKLYDGLMGAGNSRLTAGGTGQSSLTPAPAPPPRFMAPPQFKVPQRPF